MEQPAIFDRASRRLRRDRAARFAGDDFLRALMLDGIVERLATVRRGFVDVLDLGCGAGDFLGSADQRVLRVDAGQAFARAAGGVQADEDRLPVADGSIDLAVSIGVLDQINDLPGALTLVRRALRPDGLFLAAFLGGDSLTALRRAFADAERERPVARFHPRVDVRAAGDLLARAGFALPVAAIETVEVRYAAMSRLLDDLRAMAATNLLVGRIALSRATLARAAVAFTAQADPDGRTAERFDILYLTGWAPAPDQPRPARRGSATASLAAALKPRA